jgi:hypothetical protein
MRMTVVQQLANVHLMTERTKARTRVKKGVRMEKQRRTIGGLNNRLLC